MSDEIHREETGFRMPGSSLHHVHRVWVALHPQLCWRDKAPCYETSVSLTSSKLSSAKAQVYAVALLRRPNGALSWSACNSVKNNLAGGSWQSDHSANPFVGPCVYVRVSEVFFSKHACLNMFRLQCDNLCFLNSVLPVYCYPGGKSR